MSRLSRFENYRFIGLRDSMRVYDCDISDQLAALQSKVDEGDMVASKQVQAFSPDTIEEAANRGFRPV